MARAEQSPPQPSPSCVPLPAARPAGPGALAGSGDACGHIPAARNLPPGPDIAQDRQDCHAGDQGACCAAPAAVLTPSSQPPGCASSRACCATPSAKAVDTPTAPAGSRTSRFRIEAMDCPTEEALIRDKLQSMAGIKGLQFNLMQRVLTVHHELDGTAGIEAAIAGVGMRAEPLEQTAAGAPSPQAQASPLPAAPWWPLALGGAAALAAEVAEWSGTGTPWLPAACALAAIAIAGIGTYRKGWIALRHGNLNINALMSIAVTGAVLIGHWPEAAMVMVLFALAERIEAASLDRARHAIRGLMAMAPEQATIQQPDGSWRTEPANQVAIGAVARLRPGERVALDGLVLRGRSALDQSPITGESVPVDKQPGDALFAGSVNQTGELEYRVTAPASASTLARIVEAVQSAQSSRAPTQRFVDRFARVYTPVVFAIAVLVALLPPLWFGGGWLDWAYRALVLLVIACPCALVISTPVTIVSALAAAARHGILVKGGVYLEQGKALRWLVLDKTGTITSGRPWQTGYQRLSAASPADAVLRTIAASLAARSDHPVSQAVAAAAERDGVPLQEVAAFQALPGLGATGRVDGATWWLGNHRLVHQLGLCSPELENRLDAVERQGHTAVLLVGGARTDALPSGAGDGAGQASGAVVHALFLIQDTVRDTSRQAIAELHALGVRTMLLSGDNPHTATAIAAQVGIDDALGNQLPQDKADQIDRLASTHPGRVGMVGDGINDAPALARADIGFAMGAAGTDTAIETADVALMDDDLRKIPAFIRLSRRTGAVLTQNIVLALGIKAVFLALTMAGMGTMWMAVFADMGASLLVVFNGLRLVRALPRTASR